MSTEPDAADVAAALRNIPIFAGVDSDELASLCEAAERRFVAAGDWLFHAGEPSDAIYVINSGKFAAVDADGVVVRELVSGDSIGELGLIAEAPRSAGVQATRDGTVWGIAAGAFADVLAKNSGMQSEMLRTMARLLRESRSAISSQRPRVIAVVAPGDTGLAPTIDALTTYLDKYGTYQLVRPPIESTASIEHYGQLVEEFSETLDRAERSHDWVLLVAEPGCGELWQRYVVTQSDRFVVLVDEVQPPESLIAINGPGPVHLLIDVDEPDPSWWETLSPRSHHRADDDGIATLARRIAGRSLGLVLAGGGARGLAHFGVYEELIEAGVVIDRFGGTSAGALAAAAFAMGMEASAATAAATILLAGSNPLGDYAIPAVALTRGGRADRMIEEFYGQVLIEHLPKEFFSVSSDMISGEQIVHRRGRLSLAVRASISIPGLMPPVQHGDRLLVDGGLLNNLPADVMCADEDGEVICVDLRRNYVPSTGFGLLPGFLQPPTFLRRLMTGTELALPPLQETLFRTVDLAASSGNLRELPRIAAIVEPDVTTINPLDFKRIDDALKAGREAARVVLDQQPELIG